MGCSNFKRGLCIGHMISSALRNILCELDPLDLGVKITQNFAKCPLHHVTYAPTDFKVTTSIALGEEVFKGKFNI